MPSFLGDYSGNYGRSATDREAKLDRAIMSVVAQMDDDFELIVVADGCERTWALREKYLEHPARICFMRIPKQRLWSEVPRNTGIMRAEGEYIVYLDTDDYMGEEHLLGIRKGLSDAGFPLWAVMDDLWFNVPENRWEHNVADLSRAESVGTSNLVHRAGIFWPKITFRHPSNGYDHDRQFTRMLMQLQSGGAHIGAGQYHVCHIPRSYDI